MYRPRKNHNVNAMLRQLTQQNSQLDLESIPKAAKSLAETQVGGYDSVLGLVDTKIRCMKCHI
jgi:hypothetical protein